MTSYVLRAGKGVRMKSQWSKNEKPMFGGETSRQIILLQVTLVNRIHRRLEHPAYALLNSRRKECWSTEATCGILLTRDGGDGGIVYL